ncbi:siderophore-iron reductase FhuF [Variovorax sp. PAMC26660]|nr:siderophore-iron reductase FhuF [Variovorax sp. PAMC26660]
MQGGETSCKNEPRALPRPSVIALLEPIFRGELAPLGERLVCTRDLPPDALRVADLASSTEMLAGVLHRHAKFRRVEDNDLRAVASAWSLAYLSVLLPPVVAAASVLQHGFPVAASQMWVQFDGRGAPSHFHIRELGAPLHGTDTAQRYAPLLWHHLAPLFEAVAGLTRLAPKILWGNVARVLEPILDQAVALTGGAAPITQDRAHLLQSAAWPQAATNPLHGRQREVVQWRGGRQVPTKLHRQCCLNHLLPDEAACSACPLALPR